MPREISISQALDELRSVVAEYRLDPIDRHCSQVHACHEMIWRPCELLPVVLLGGFQFSHLEQVLGEVEVTELIPGVVFEDAPRMEHRPRKLALSLIQDAEVVVREQAGRVLAQDVLPQRHRALFCS